METVTLDEFIAKYKAQAPSNADVVFRCPMCKTLQSARDLIAAGAGTTFDDVEGYLGFSCVGRFQGGDAPRKVKDGKDCNWTLGGLFKVHELEVITPDGKRHPRFSLASPEEAAAHRAHQSAASTV